MFNLFPFFHTLDLELNHLINKIGVVCSDVFPDFSPCAVKWKKCSADEHMARFYL